MRTLEFLFVHLVQQNIMELNKLDTPTVYIIWIMNHHNRLL